MAALLLHRVVALKYFNIPCVSAFCLVFGAIFPEGGLCVRYLHYTGYFCFRYRGCSCLSKRAPSFVARLVAIGGQGRVVQPPIAGRLSVVAHLLTRDALHRREVCSCYIT